MTQSKGRNKPKSDNITTDLDKKFWEAGPEDRRRILPGGVRDWGGRARTSAEISDDEERKAGRKLKAAYYPMIGDAPVLGPGDHTGATHYLHKISQAIARGGWTRTEWKRLQLLHKKWFRRANGTDPYFEVYGNRRQWADHGTTYRNREDKRMADAVQGIKAIVWGAVMDQLSRTPKDETPAEKRARQEEINAHRRSTTEGQHGQQMYD